MFDNSNVNITVEGKTHLGAIVGSDGYKREYVDKLVNDWNNKLCILSTVAESQPQAAYSAFVSGYKNKLSYFLRTIPDISNLLLPVEGTIRNRFMPAITGGRICNEEAMSYYLYQLDIDDQKCQFSMDKLKLCTTTEGEQQQN